MLKEQQRVVRKLLLLSDMVIVTLAFILGHAIRRGSDVFAQYDQFAQIYPIQEYVNVLPIFVVFWGFSLFFMGLYGEIRGRKLGNIHFDLLKATLLATMLFGSYAYLMKIQYVSRTLIVITSVLSLAGLSLQRIVILEILHRLGKRGIYIRNILIVGTGRRAQSFMDIVEAHREWGFNIVGLVDVEEGLVGTKIRSYEVLGVLRDLPDLLEKKVVDEVVFVVPRGWLSQIEDSILYCELLGKRVSVAVDLFNLKFAKPRPRDFYSYPLMTFETTTDKLFALFFKRVMDLLIAGAAMIVAFPIIVTAMILIKTTSKGPTIFKQVRCGLNGRKFTVYKLRTMVHDAEKQLEELRQKNEMTGPAFKMKDDPRLIRFGKFMRKFSIDELPQLFNVLEGNMSVVGPRPPIPAEVKKYEPWQLRRLSMRPGLTCIWQVQGRNKIVKFEEWMKLDLEYIDTWSLWLDVKLFLKTIPIVFFGIGAK